MPGIIGPRAAVDLALPDSIDAGTIFEFEMRSGSTPEQVIAQAAARIGEANQGLLNRWGGLLYITDGTHAYYRQGASGRRKTPVKTENATVDPVRGAMAGHMLPLVDFEDVLGWSPAYLRDAYAAQIAADIETVVEAWEYRVAYDIMQVMLTNEEVGVGSGWAVGWARGNGGNVSYTPPNYKNKEFDATHDHYIWRSGTVTAANLKSNIAAQIKTLREHGHTGTLVACVSDEDVDTWAEVDGFVELKASEIVVIEGGNSRLVSTARGQAEGVPGELFGYYNDKARGLVELYSDEIVPTGYSAVAKSYGVNNMNNPLAIRVHPTADFGLVPMPTVTRHLEPKLESIEFEGTHGVSANNRTAGSASVVASGLSAWSNATIAG